MFEIFLDFLGGALVDQGAFFEEEDGGEEGEDLGGGLKEGEDASGVEVGRPGA